MMVVEGSKESSKQYINVIRELTRREIKRKYARSFLGVIWSVLNPLLYMAVVTFVFSYLFSKGIENYPAYYLTGYIIFTLIATGSTTSMTALKDNRNLMLKTKWARQTFVLSRVYTSFVNFLLSCISYVIVLIVFRVNVGWTVVFFPLDIFFVMIFLIGLSYALSIWHVFLGDAKIIYGTIIMVIRFFSGLFYNVDTIDPGIRTFISFNPIYVFIKVARDSTLYGKIPEMSFLVQMVIWSVGMFIIGRLIFKYKENKVMEKI